MNQQTKATQLAGQAALSEGPVSEQWTGLDSEYGQVAALADGAVDRREAQMILDRLIRSETMRSTWNEIHLIGDCLRSDDLAHNDDGAGFLRRFSEHLEKEPPIIAPRPLNRGLHRKWLRYGLPGVSVAAAVAMVTWMILPQINPAGPVVVAAKPAAPTLAAQAGVSGPGVASQPAAVDMAKLNEYLAAHRQLSDSMVRGPGYVQSASMSFSRPEQE